MSPSQRPPVVQTHSDNDEDAVELLDARKWVQRLKQSKPTVKPASQKKRKEYSAADLEGVRVAHMAELLGSEHVLTLPDKSIDELDDTDITELHDESLNHAKRGHEDGDPQSITINPGGIIQAPVANGQILDSLDSAPAASDFYTEAEAEVLFRKPRRRGKRSKTSTTNDLPLLDVDAGDAIYSRRMTAQVDDDDEDLQRAIAQVRRSAVTTKPASAEDIARQVHDDSASRMDTVDDADAELALSSTLEFVQSLKASRKPEPKVKEEEEEVETVIVKREAPVPIIKENVKEEPNLAEPSLVEPSVGSGLVATLNLLRQRNMLDKITEDQHQREAQQRSRDLLVASQRRQDSALASERQRIKQIGIKVSEPRGRRGKADDLTPQEVDELRAREQEALDRKWARECEDRMRDYKPQVALEYVDETGRQLTTKEAYKQLSHAFHGHYSGKNKIDKLMRRREKERRQLDITSAVSTHQYGAVLENAHKKLGAAGIVLASGNKPGLGPSTKDHRSK
ncbi:hypothetical protein GGI20_004533 [Coemansia sp. BCRC 34301]|nr:hypothetical protein GGI20_004533 [Coemansia sp. BCRC 34301]